MDIQIQELQKAIEYIRQTFADKKINLDYSAASVKHLDTLFDNEYKEGKLRNADGGFAKFQGIIITGVSGYIAQVIIKNTGTTKIVADANDEKWFMNFKVASSSGQFVQPGVRVIKRMLQGAEMGLYSYVLSSIRYFSAGASPGSNSPDNIVADIKDKKPWWKMW